MRKLLPFIVVGILVLSGLGAVSGSESNEESFVSEKIFFSQPTILEKEDYVYLESTDATVYSGEQDKPALPVITKVYTFPFGTRIDSVDVTFSDFTEIEMSKPIEPSPEILVISTSVSHNIEESEEILTYSDIEVYPEERFGYRAASGLKGEENVLYVTVSLYPDQYFPQQNIVSHAENAEIDIKYTLPETPVTFPDEYDEYYTYYVEYAKNIKTILMDEWDFNVFLEKYPSPILFSIDKKLDKILKTKK